MYVQLTHMFTVKIFKIKEGMWLYPVWHGNPTSREAQLKSKELWRSNNEQCICHSKTPLLFISTEGKKRGKWYEEMQHTWHHCLTVHLRNNTTQNSSEMIGKRLMLGIPHHKKHAFLQRKEKTSMTTLWHKVTENWHYLTQLQESSKAKRDVLWKVHKNLENFVSLQKYSSTEGIKTILREGVWAVFCRVTLLLSALLRCLVRLQQKGATASFEITPVYKVLCDFSTAATFRGHLAAECNIIFLLHNIFQDWQVCLGWEIIQKDACPPM